MVHISHRLLGSVDADGLWITLGSVGHQKVADQSLRMDGRKGGHPCHSRSVELAAL